MRREHVVSRIAGRADVTLRCTLAQFRMLSRCVATAYQELPHRFISPLVPVPGIWEARQLPGWCCREWE